MSLANIIRVVLAGAIFTSTAYFFLRDNNKQVKFADFTTLTKVCERQELDIDATAYFYGDTLLSIQSNVDDRELVFSLKTLVDEVNGVLFFEYLGYLIALDPSKEAIVIVKDGCMYGYGNAVINDGRSLREREPREKPKGKINLYSVKTQNIECKYPSAFRAD